MGQGMDRHLLIAGQGRAGSTLFYSMMQHALSGFTMPETEVRAGGFLSLPGNVCTKRPYDIFDFAKLAEAAEGRKQLDLIVTLRDPRDVLTSMHKAVPDDYFYSADLTYNIHTPGGPKKTMPGLILVHMAILEALKSGLLPRGAFLLKYEHLVADPDRIQAMLAEGMGLDFHARFSDFHKRDVDASMDRAMNGLRPVDGKQIEKWRAPKHRTRIIDQFTRFPTLHDIVIDLGYEPDTSWFDALREETADLDTQNVSRVQRRAGL